MTRATNARVAGVAYLLYIPAALPTIFLMGRATRGTDMTARLTSLAQHAGDVHLAAVLSLFGCFAALVLGVTLWAITRDEDRDLAMLGLTCRAAEGIVGAVSVQQSAQLLWLGATATGAADPAATRALGEFLLSSGQGWSTVISATFFAVGSTLFCWLLLRGRMIPLALAWLGVLASVLLVVSLPLRLGGVLSASVAQLTWLPIAAFEIPVAIWFIVKGVAPPARVAVGR